MADDKIALGGYVMNKKGASKVDYSTPAHLDKWDEEGIAAETYEVAPKVYYNYTWWKDTNYHVDDFTQDAVMYILDLYKKDYFPTDRDNIKGIIYRLLNGFFVRNKFKSLTKDKSTLSLDNTIGTSDKSYMDSVESEDISPEDAAYVEEQIQLGKDIFGKVIDQLNFTPYTTRVHTYKGKEKSLGTIKLTEANLGKLLVMGYRYHDILKIYNVGTTNIGTSSEATYVYRKINSTLSKMAKLLNDPKEFTDDEREAAKTYLTTIE